MDSQLILSNNDFKDQGIQNIKSKKSPGNINKKDRKANIKKEEGVKKNRKLGSDEKNFLAILVHQYLKKEINAGRKITNNREIKKSDKNVKVKRMSKIINNKGNKVRIKSDKIKEKVHPENLFKEKEKYSKVKSEKIALEKIIPQNRNKKTKKTNINNKKAGLKDTANNEVSLKIVKEQEKSSVRKAKVSKVEEIKISPDTKEIKFENFKPEKPKVNNVEVRKSNLIEEVARIVQNTTPKGNKIFRIHIEPPELGKMYIQLSFSQDKKMDMKIYVQKPEVQHFLNSGIETLKTNIENLGLKFDLPVIQTLSEFNSGEKGNEKGKEGESQKKIKFRVFTDSKENSEYYEEYIGVMDYLSGRVDIRA